MPCAPRWCRAHSAACWDVGTACLLAHVGVPLIDTTSFGAMATRGLPDAVGLATRDFMLGNARLIAAAVDLRPSRPGRPLEWFWRQSRDRCTNHPGGCTTGIVGGSIEDATGRPADSIYPLELAKVTHPRCGRGGPCATVSVHADGARRPISLGSPRPCRSDPSRAGLRDGGRQRDHGAGPQRPTVIGAQGSCIVRSQMYGAAGFSGRLY